MMITFYKNKPYARRASWILGLVCGATFLFAAAVLIANVDTFSQDLLIPCQKGKEESFKCSLIGSLAAKPLRYLGHGAEAIAFVSEDNQYVLKLFLKYDFFKKKCPQWRKCVKRLSGFCFTKRSRGQVLRRYAQGGAFLPDITGVLAVHQHRSLEQLPQCTLIDHTGVRHCIDLNHFAFVIQKKGRLVSQEEWISDRQRLDVKFQELFSAIASQGFVSLSETFNTDNFAILDDRAIMIDLGKLEYLPQQAYALEEERLHTRYITVVGKAPQQGQSPSAGTPQSGP